MHNSDCIYLSVLFSFKPFPLQILLLSRMPMLLPMVLQQCLKSQSRLGPVVLAAVDKCEQFGAGTVNKGESHTRMRRRTGMRK